MSGPDARVRTALTHWAHRMVVNGVPFADMEAVRRELTSWSSWCAAWCDRARVHEALGDEAGDGGHVRSAAGHWITAAVCYHFAKFLYFDDPDQARGAHAAAVRCHTRALPHLDPPGERLEVPFDGAPLPGVLRRPAGVPTPAVVLVISGLDSAKEEMHSYEQLLLERGVATFAFDGPGQGEVETMLPIRADWEAPVAAVLDTLAETGSVDVGRAGVFGVSLGGYYAVRAAAFEQRVRACVAVSGPYDFGAAWADMPELSKEAFRIRSHLPDPEAAGRHAARLSLAGVAPRVTCPVLVVSGGKDALFGPQHAERLAAEVAGPVTRLHVAHGTHVVNNLPFHYRPQAADWLVDTLA
jgi:dienelactone hydrolase